MFIDLCHWFTKLTAWPVQKLCFRTKIDYEDPAVQKRRIRGPAIVVCNHTSVYDVAVLMFVFFSRTLRCQVAELIFRKQPLGTLMRLLGAVRVDRNSHDFSFLEKSAQILRRGGVVEIYPEGRLPRPGEARPLDFKPSAAWLALSEGVPVIPVYTNGSYFSKRRTRVLIGAPMDLRALCRADLSDKENIALANACLREKIIALEAMCHERAENQKQEKAV